jgi:hypothetical protein
MAFLAKADIIRRSNDGDMMLPVMIDKLTGIRRRCGINTNVEKTKVKRISSQPSPLQSMIGQKQVENVEYFSYLGS